MRETMTSDLDERLVSPSAFILSRLCGGPNIFIEDRSMEETRRNERRTNVSVIVCLSLPMVHILDGDDMKTCKAMCL